MLLIIPVFLLIQKLEFLIPIVVTVANRCQVLITTILCILKVAERQGKYLAALLNKIGKEGGARAGSGKDLELGAPFVYKHLGSMATIGRYKALVDLRQSKVSDRANCSRAT